MLGNAQRNDMLAGYSRQIRLRDKVFTIFGAHIFRIAEMRVMHPSGIFP
jgi:hypothetical protein